MVTGGSRGIGEAVARQLAEEGCRLVLCARGLDEVEAVAEALRHQGAEAWAVRCDVREPAAVEALREAAEEHLGGVDILVNNAGIAPSAPIKTLGLDDWQRVFDVNVTGVYLCTRAFLPGMRQAGWGRVVTIASIASKVGHPYISAYVASKHAALGFTRAVATEVAREGVTVNAVCPGYVDTPMTEASIERISAKTGKSAEEAYEFMRRQSPQHRLIEPEEVAYATLVLCDPRAHGINGQALVVDGGGVQG